MKAMQEEINSLHKNKTYELLYIKLVCVFHCERFKDTEE